MSLEELVDDPGTAQAHKKKKHRNGLVINFDEEARRDFLTGFRKRKQERRRVAKEALEEKDRIARREAKKQKKLEMLRAYGVDVQEHVVSAKAQEATYDAADTAVTVTSSAVTTRKVPIPHEYAAADASESEDGEPESESGTISNASERPKTERPAHWKQVRQERRGTKKKAWSKSKAKKIKKQHRREAKGKKGSR